MFLCYNTTMQKFGSLIITIGIIWSIILLYAFYILDNSRNLSTIEFIKDWIMGITLAPVVIVFLIMIMFK